MLLSTRHFSVIQNCGFIFLFIMSQLSTSCSQKENSDETEQAPAFAVHGPAWSPDGSLIAFSSNLNGNDDIYTIEPNGTNLHQLTNSAHDEGEVCWSPDGTRLIFASNQSGNNAISLMNIDSPVQTRLGDSIRATSPDFSPDGSQICYEGRINGNRDIFLMNSDGTDVTRLTTNEANDFGPSFSADGSQILFNSKREGTYDIFIMNADGSNIVRLTDSELHETRPTWSHGGTKVLFISIAVIDGKEVSQGLHLIDLESKQIVQVTDSEELEPSISPDGTMIAYINGNGLGLFVMNADGSNRRKLVPLANVSK